MIFSYEIQQTDFIVEILNRDEILFDQCVEHNGYFKG